MASLPQQHQHDDPRPEPPDIRRRERRRAPPDQPQHPAGRDGRRRPLAHARGAGHQRRRLPPELDAADRPLCVQFLRRHRLRPERPEQQYDLGEHRPPEQRRRRRGAAGRTASQHRRRRHLGPNGPRNAGRPERHQGRPDPPDKPGQLGADRARGVHRRLVSQHGRRQHFLPSYGVHQHRLHRQRPRRHLRRGGREQRPARVARHGRRRRRGGQQRLLRSPSDQRGLPDPRRRRDLDGDQRRRQRRRGRHRRRPHAPRRHQRRPVRRGRRHRQRAVVRRVPPGQPATGGEHHLGVDGRAGNTCRGDPPPSIWNQRPRTCR